MNKHRAIVAGVVLVISGAFIAASLDKSAQRQWTKDNQVAAGEWKIEVQVPPCEEYKNIQVIYPTHEGPITIECNLMPVKEK